jgi:hypothetical protein
MSENTKKMLECTVGIALCAHARDFLKKLQFVGYDITWIESSGFLERTFIIKGSDEGLQKVKAQFDEWGSAHA